MPSSKTDCTRTSASQLTASGLSGKTVTDVLVTQHASVTVIEIVFSGGSKFIKVKDNNQVEVGGTLDFGTGTAAF
jgi:hypothetical protein